jgi:hypothetical protein
MFLARVLPLNIVEAAIPLQFGSVQVMIPLTA